MIVVDTHVILWDALAPQRLSKAAAKAISRANETDGIIVCDISLWEIAMLIKKRRVRIDTDYLSFIRLIMASNNYAIHPITPDIAECSSYRLPATLKDPADRIISATSIIEHAPLITADKRLRAAKEIATVW